MNQHQQHAKGGLGLLALAFLLITGGLYFLYTAAAQAAPISILASQPSLEAPTENTPTFNLPTRLNIPQAGIDLPVAIGIFDQTVGQWNINDTHAFFAHTATTPLFYGHNQPGLFEGLARVKSGDTAALSFQDGTSITLRYDKTRFVSPNDASVLTEENPRTIMLLTCSGLFNESRRLVYFKEML